MDATQPVRCRAFTLIETAIVVTVIALVIGAVLTGRQLLRSAKVQSVIADMDAYRSAARHFREKYGYLPGDLPTATEFWGAYRDCPVPLASSERKMNTCNGDGNGFVGSTSGSPLQMGEIAKAVVQEPLRVWQHLSNSGFINGQYAGARSSAPGASPFGLDPGLNIPAGSIEQSGFTLHFAGNVTPGSAPGVYGARYGHVVVFGRTEARSCPSEPCFGSQPLAFPARWPAITAGEASTIDLKMDDGRPGTGAVLTYPPPTSACASSADERAASYGPGDGQAACALVVITGL